MNFAFFLKNILLGAGLSMDACAVSMSDGLEEPDMPRKKHIAIAATFAVFQATMPLIGYFAGFAAIDFVGAYVPWLALGVLVILGGKMIFDGVKEFVSEKRAAVARLESAAVSAVPTTESKENTRPAKNAESLPSRRKLTAKTLFVQAIATSIDALGVGLTIIDYTIVQAIITAAIIAAVTFLLCLPSVYIGKKFGDRLGKSAVIVGGAILIAIGIEICLTGVL